MLAIRKTLLSPSRNSFQQSRSQQTLRGLSSLEKYGLGGHNWKKFDPSSYQELIHQALTKNVSWFEVAGQDGGDVAMVGGIKRALDKSPSLAQNQLTVTARLGYRTLESSSKDGSSTDQAEVLISGDYVLQEENSSNSPNVAHNISSDFVLDTIQSSPLWELRDEFGTNLNLIFLIHNPEVQALSLGPESTQQDRQAVIRENLTPTLKSLQEYSAESENAVSFGIVSNGLGIPSQQDHPMHLGSDIVIDAINNYNRFSTVQLPANLLERHGWDVAREIRAATSNVDVVAMRPLTCYPDLGTGSGFPFRLVDYSLPSLETAPNFSDTSPGNTSSHQRSQYTNEMSGIPAIYQIALQTAMSHFDAEEILEAKQTRELSVEERETLDGCKLVQSMIHDLDSDLENIRSFAAHEDELYGRIIPLLYDTFEAMDDQTSNVLQAYFAAYAVAVRYAIAKATRRVLMEGENNDGIKGSESHTYPDIPQEMTLQEYALRQMLSDSCFSRLVIGSSTMEDFEHQTELFGQIEVDL